VGVNVTEGDIGRLHFSHVTEGLKKKALRRKGKTTLTIGYNGVRM
jgi:hypothetical protein